jgi:hypothetical protein
VFEYFQFTIKFPYRLKKSSHKTNFNGYKVIYRKQNGSLFIQNRINLPRIVEVPDYVQLRIDQYKGKSNGFGWIIEDIKII